MTKSTNTNIIRSALVFWCLFYAAAVAQEPAEEPAANAVSTEAAPADAPTEEITGPVTETNPAVRAALELPREAPADYFRAIDWLIDLGRPELAKPILEELSALPLIDSQRAVLVEEFGSARMLKLARAKELAPKSAEFSNACMASAAAIANDPQRISRLVAQLTDASPELRLLARNDLAATGQTGIVATLEALARERVPARRAALAAAASGMTPLVEGPLLAMLSTSDAALRSEVGSLLLQLGVTQAAPFLATDAASAESALLNAIARYSAGTPPFAPDDQNRVEIWHWNDASKKLSAARYAAEDASVIWLARLARLLATWRPDNHAYQGQAWLWGLEATGLVGRSQASLAAIDSYLLNDILRDALERNYAHAAVAAADELGRRRDLAALYTPDGRPSPLVDSLLHPDRRVRFAGLRAIMALNPARPYPGSSRVSEALAWFAAATGQRRALVAMPTNLMATDLAGMLAAHGIDGEATNRGRDAVDLARELADLEMIFVDMDILVPDVRQVLYELRIQAETGQTPIAILAADGRLEAAQRLASEHERVLAVSRPHSPEVLARTAEALYSLADDDLSSANERANEAVQALTWLAQLLSRRDDAGSLYDLHRAATAIESALYRPDAANLAITALARLGTPQSQQALVRFASEQALPAPARSQAVQAFRSSVEEHGLLLTTDEILTQYDRYNASAKADVQTQQFLGQLLDVIESRRNAQR
jgi:hypothetical protein